MKMETAVPVLMDKSGIRIGSCRLSQIFILRMCYNINIERRLPGDEGPFLSSQTCYPEVKRDVG